MAKPIPFFCARECNSTMGPTSLQTMCMPRSRVLSSRRKGLVALAPRCSQPLKPSMCAISIRSNSSSVRHVPKSSCWAPLPVAGTSSCVRRRWKITTIACGRSKPSRGPARQRYECHDCNTRFDDLTDTIFAGHHQPLKVWILCLYFMGLNVSNEQIAHELSINESDAYQMTTELRGGIVKKTRVAK